MTRVEFQYKGVIKKTQNQDYTGGGEYQDQFAPLFNVFFF